MNDNFVESDNNATEVLRITPQRNISFSNESEEVGRLSWNDGVMVFTGDADESAKIFFDYLKEHIDNYIGAMEEA